MSPTHGGTDRTPLVGVLTALAVSLTGTRLAAIALPWFVLVQTDSATMTGLLAFCEMAPYVIVKTLSGPVMDSVGPRRISIAADTLSGLVMGLVPLLWAIGQLHLAAVFVAAVVVGAARGPGDAAKEVFVPDIAERAGTPLERVTGLSGTIERLASTVGPAAAGVLVAVVGAVPTLGITAGSALFSAVAIAMSTRSLRPVHRDEGEPGGYLRRLRAGYTFLRGERLLWSVVVMVTVTNFLDAALMQVLVPVWAKESGAGPAAIGLVSSCLGVSAVVGSLAATVFAERLPRRLVYVTGFLVGGAPRYVALALDLPVWAIAAVWLACGFGVGFINPVIAAIAFERTPRHMLGRVNAIGDGMAWSLIPVGGVAAAAALSVVGLGPALLVAGAGYLLSTVLPALRPEWRDMDRRGNEQPAAPTDVQLTRAGDREPTG